MAGSTKDGSGGRSRLPGQGQSRHLRKKAQLRVRDKGTEKTRMRAAMGIVPMGGEQSTTMGLRVPEVRGELERKVSYSMDKGRGSLEGFKQIKT